MSLTFDANTLFGSLSLILGYLFDVPVVLDILLEDNGQYVPKLLLDDAMPDDDKAVAKLIDVIEILLRYVDENSDVSSYSGSLSTSPFEFLLSTSLQIVEPLEGIQN